MYTQLTSTTHTQYTSTSKYTILFVCVLYKYKINHRPIWFYWKFDLKNELMSAFFFSFIYYFCCKLYSVYNLICCRLGCVYLFIHFFFWFRVLSASKWNNLNWNWLQNSFDQFVLWQECTAHHIYIYMNNFSIKMIAIDTRLSSIYELISLGVLFVFIFFLNVFLNVQFLKASTIFHH